MERKDSRGTEGGRLKDMTRKETKRRKKSSKQRNRQVSARRKGKRGK